MLEELVTAVRLDLAAPLSRTPVGAVGWVERAVDRFHGLHPTLSVRVEAGPGVERAHVQGDSSLLRRVLDNLLENAAKHGAPPFAVELTRGDRDGHDGVEVRVRDRGPGIPPDEVDRLFEPFARGAVARASGVPGSGLGLALARRIVTAHGGTLTLERSDSGGTCFCVSLPSGEGQGA
jgi:signal transduction histidine kinase